MEDASRHTQGREGLRKTLIALLAFAPAAAFAFRSDEWLAKREILSREAERLQAAYTSCVARLDEPAADVTIPFERHADGSVKASVTAKKAQVFLDTGMIWGSDVVVSQFSTNGVEDAHVEADGCVIDRVTKSGWVQGHARALHLGNEVEGDGIYFSFEEEFVTIYANTKIRVKDQKFDTKAIAGGLGKAAKRDAEISAVRTDYDRKDGVVLFDGAVSVSDAEYSLGADRIFAFLDGTNSLKRIVADGSVTVTNGTRSGGCPRASYEKSLGRVTMFGEEGNPAKLVDAGSRRSEIEGRKITFWLDSEQVEVEGSTLTVEGGVSGDMDDFMRQAVE